MTVTVITNLPCLSGILWGPNLSKYEAGPTPSNLISQFKNWEENKDEETVGKILFKDIPKGLYELRLSLPYYNHGQLFDMIVVMNKFIALLDGDIELTFKATISQPLPKEVENTSSV